MESTQNPSGNDLVLQRVETRKAQMKRLVCVTERLIHFCVSVYLLHSLADKDLSLEILYKIPQAPVVRKRGLRVKFYSRSLRRFWRSNFTLNVKFSSSQNLKVKIFWKFFYWTVTKLDSDFAVTQDWLNRAFKNWTLIVASKRSSKRICRNCLQRSFGIFFWSFKI